MFIAVPETGKNHMKISWLLKTVVCLAVLFLLLVFWSMFFPTSHQGNDPVSIKFRNAAKIGSAFYKYQDANDGRLPLRLSELVPRYVGSSNIVWFFWPPTSETATNVFRQIDDEGAFVYLGKRGFPDNLVMYERTNLWPQNEDTASVVTLTTNFTARLQSVRDIKARLSNLPSVEAGRGGQGASLTP
ncbi:MAG: hypothetical protein ABSA69_05735 [Verrucomicrobiota bacterium]